MKAASYDSKEVSLLGDLKPNFPRFRDLWAMLMIMFEAMTWVIFLNFCREFLHAQSFTSVEIQG